MAKKKSVTVQDGVDAKRLSDVESAVMVSRGEIEALAKRLRQVEGDLTALWLREERSWWSWLAHWTR